MPKGAIVQKCKKKNGKCVWDWAIVKKIKSGCNGVLKHSQNQKRHTKQKKTYKQMLQYQKT